MQRKLFASLILLFSVITLAAGCGSSPKCKQNQVLKKGVCVDKSTAPVCGDGKVTGHETCDVKIAAGQPGHCPAASECVDNLESTASYSGTLLKCDVKCSYTERPCSGGTSDGYCPSTCNQQTDIDCRATKKLFEPCLEDSGAINPSIICPGNKYAVCFAVPHSLDKGMCTLRCGTNDSRSVQTCPQNSTCDQINHVCVPTCTGSQPHKAMQGSCPSGFTCFNPVDLPKGYLASDVKKSVCIDSTEEDSCNPSDPNSCPRGKKCGKPFTGSKFNHCVDYGDKATATTGTACATAADCSGGYDAACVILSRSTLGKTGYCSKTCDLNTPNSCGAPDLKCIPNPSADLSNPKKGMCSQTCDTDINKCTPIEGYICGLIEGGKKACIKNKKVNCEDLNHIGQPDPSICEQRIGIGSVCNKQGSTFYCTERTLCNKGFTFKEGPEESKCPIGIKCIEDNLKWVCANPATSCDDGSGQPDQSKCGPRNPCAKDTMGNWVCQPQTLCSDASGAPDQSKCPEGAKCQTFFSTNLCLAATTPSYKNDYADAPDVSKCRSLGQGALCGKDSNNEWKCSFTHACMDKSGKPNDTLCKDFPGATCTVKGPNFAFCTQK